MKEIKPDGRTRAGKELRALADAFEDSSYKLHEIFNRPSRMVVFISHHTYLGQWICRNPIKCVNQMWIFDWGELEIRTMEW